MPSGGESSAVPSPMYGKAGVSFFICPLKKAPGGAALDRS
jgi:hypothetical protein